MEACETCQFENHLRAVLGLPLGSTEMVSDAALMVNVLGMASMKETRDLFDSALKVPGAGVNLRLVSCLKSIE